MNSVELGEICATKLGTGGSIFFRYVEWPKRLELKVLLKEAQPILYFYPQEWYCWYSTNRKNTLLPHERWQVNCQIQSLNARLQTLVSDEEKRQIRVDIENAQKTLQLDSPEPKAIWPMVCQRVQLGFEVKAFNCLAGENFCSPGQVVDAVRGVIRDMDIDISAPSFPVQLMHYLDVPRGSMY